MENYETSDRIITPVREALYALAANQIPLLKSLDDVSQPAVILDLGTCDGRTTVPCFQECVKRIRERDAETHRPIIAIYEDHRHNDWKPLICRNLKQELGEGVHPLVSNTSFFEQTTARNSVDLAFSCVPLTRLICTPHLRALHSHLTLWLCSALSILQELRASLLGER